MRYFESPNTTRALSFFESRVTSMGPFGDSALATMAVLVQPKPTAS